MAHSRTYLPPRGWPPKYVQEVDALTMVQFLRTYADGRPVDSMNVNDFLELTAMVRERTVRQRYPQADITRIDQTAYRSVCGPFRMPDFCSQYGFIPVRIVAATSPRKRAPARFVVATPWPSDDIIRGITAYIQTALIGTALDGVVVDVHVCTAEEFARTMDELHTMYPRPRMGPGRTREEFAVRDAVATARRSRCR